MKGTHHWNPRMAGNLVPGSTPRGTRGKRKTDAPRGRPQPINLQVAQDTNVLANPDNKMRGVCGCITLSKGMWSGHIR